MPASSNSSNTHTRSGRLRRNVHVGFTTCAEVKARLEALAKQQDRSLSQLLDKLMRDLTHFTE